MKRDGLEISSNGNWAACRICADLIDRERWTDLLDRSVATFEQKYGWVPKLRQHIRQFHQQFRDHRRREA